MATNENGAGSDVGNRAGPGSSSAGMGAMPVVWVGVVMAMAVWGIMRAWQGTLDYRMPDEVVYLLYAEMSVAAVMLLAGLYLLGLAWRGSGRFAFWFTLWQGFAIVAQIAFQTWTLFSEMFVMSLWPWLLTIGEIVIGVVMIVLARRHWASRPTAATPPPPGVYLINGFLGAIAGGVIGAVGGFIAGAFIVEAMQVSCFEGACGYAAAAIGLLAMIVCATAGLLITILRTRRAAARVF